MKKITEIIIDSFGFLACLGVVMGGYVIIALIA